MSESPPLKSAHAKLLNALSDMQGSFAYVARRRILQEAEETIVAQEAEIIRLRAQLTQKEKP